ncbi:MAG: aldo/keto reductase [Deltaproteobacteria bacterium]|nr:aldo/keto reductase [Deltaproteobacteria bacterium]
MEKRSLGTSGLEASLVGLGCNNFGMRIGLAETRAVIDAALDAGVTFLDTADVYGNGLSEEFIGQILGARRKQVVLATKFGSAARKRRSGERWGTRAYIAACIESSLRQLRTDWIDLYQMHYPDPATPIEETLLALEDLVRQGKVRAAGCSNFSSSEIAEAASRAQERHWAGFLTAQNEWSLLNRQVENDVIPVCERFGLAQLPYYPLASGLLTGKYRWGEPFPSGTRLAAMEYFRSQATEENFAKVKALENFAKARNRTILELAMSWLAAQPSVASVIAGATTPEQVRANVAAVNWKFSVEELAEIDRLVPLAAV